MIAMKELLLLFVLISCSLCLDVQWKRLLWKQQQLNYAKNDRKDRPLDVEVTDIGDRYVTLNITGSDTVDGLPVQQLVVNYTLNGPTGEVQTKTLSTVAADGRLEQLITLEDLLPGRLYKLQFSAENSRKQVGPPSAWVPVLLLPPTPDITVDHISLGQLRVKWEETKSQSEDYYLLTVEKVGVFWMIVDSLIYISNVSKWA